jgi:hypothetical protein
MGRWRHNTKAPSGLHLSFCPAAPIITVMMISAAMAGVAGQKEKVRP